MSEASNTVFLTGRQNGMPDRQKIAKGTLSFFLPVLVLMIAVTAAIEYLRGKAEMEAYQSMARHNVDIQAVNIDGDIRQISSDVAILVYGRTMERLWDDDGIPIPGVLADLTQDFLNLSMRRRLYDQVRLLDENGMEIARVNFNSGHPAIVPRDRLQNKKGRYYFDDAFRLSQGEVFVSPLDLNIEHGEIERPFKPMIRFATPVFDRRGEKRGIVLLNYFGAKLLDRFSNQADASGKIQTMLLNSDGHWLRGPTSDDEWGFMYEDRKDRTFANVYPEAWKRIKSEESCQFEMPKGMFSSKTVYPLLEGQKSSTGSGKAFSPSLAQLEPNEYWWKIVSFASSDVLYLQRNTRRKYAATVLALLAMTWLLGSWWLAKAAMLRRQAEEAFSLENKIKAAESSIRIAIASMDQPKGLEEVAREIETQMRQLGVDLDSLSIQVVNQDGSDFISIGGGQGEKVGLALEKLNKPSDGENASTYPWVIDVWKIQETRYVSSIDLAETSNRTPMHGLSLIDTPFSQGTLAINSRRQDAFTKADIALLERFAYVLSDGFQRFVDTADRKQAEEALRRSERDRQAWIENSPVCTKILDLDFNLQFMSASGIRGLNIDDINEFYGKPYPLDFYPDSVTVQF